MKVKHGKKVREVLKKCLHFPEEWKYRAGVYIIHHIKKPDQIYVGSTSNENKYKGLLDRFRVHYSKLLRKEHHSILLQRAVNKYGIDGIRFTPLEIYPPELCLGMEQYYINMFKPFYNTCLQAGSRMGMKHTEETKDKIRKRVVKYSLEGIFIEEYKGMTTAARENNADKKHISATARGKINSAYGFLWRYLEDVQGKNGVITKKIQSPYKEHQLDRGRGCKIVVYTLDGNFYKIYSNIEKAAEELNLISTSIGNCVKSRQTRHGDYMFHYFKKGFKKKIKPYSSIRHNQKKVEITFLETGEIKIYESVAAVKRGGGEVPLKRIWVNGNKGITKFKYPKENPKYLIEVKSYK